MAKRRVTSIDVAKLAKVSQSTVSRVINGTPGAPISAETRERVLEAARQLDYHPSAAARSLVRQQTRALGLILREAPDRQAMYTFQSLVVQGAASTARLNGFKLLVEVVPDNTPPEDYFS